MHQLLLPCDCCLQVKCTHITEVDYIRAAAGEWIQPGSLPPAAAAVQQLSIPSFAAVPGIPGLPGLGAGLIPGLPGQAPLTIPSLTSAALPAGFGAIPGFPPPP